VFDTKTSLQRLRAIGLTTNQAHDLVILVQKWIRESGEEWAVDRIKAIKLNLLHHFSGLEPVKTHSWIRYGPKGPKGPFRALFQLSKRDFWRAWNAVMVYTGISFQHPELRVTERQWRKAISAIRREPVNTERLVEGLKVVHESPFFVPVRVREETGSPLVDYQPSPSRRSPKGFKTVPEVEGVIDSLDVLVQRTTWTVQNWDILSGVVKGIEGEVVPDLELNLEDERKAGGPPTDEDLRPLMGNISLIQEPGYKLRFAANPYRVYQCALEPLGTALFDALKRVPNDFTFDQEAGIAYAQKLLTLGYPAVSMDLSNATDRAPLDFQLELLSRLGVSTRWIQFLRDCCRGDWFTQTARHDPWKRINWSVGSPLGLYPTFASFALWHHSVVQYSFSVLGKPKIDGQYPYGIVGDDVFIMDREVASLYRQLMESWGVEISGAKTLDCNTTAEFLGRIITPNRVYHGLKWKGRVSDDSFVDFVRNIGPGALTLLRPRQRAMIDFVAPLPEPYGLGWNPLGLPVEERLTPLLERVWSRDERVVTFNRRSARANRLFYHSDRSWWWRPQGPSDRYWDAEDLANDQLAEEVTADLLPGWESGEWIWPNLPEIVRLRSETSRETSEKLRLMLRRSSYTERRSEVSTLVVLERKFRHVLSRSRGTLSFTK